MTPSPYARQAVTDPAIDEPSPGLIAAIRTGDAEALGAVYRQHAPRLLRVAQRIMQHPEDAEDVLHDVFVGLPVALKHYEPRGRFGSWLITCTVRTALMRRRAQQRRQEVAMDGAWAVGNQPLANSRPDLAPEVAEIEVRLGALPEAQRAVLTLRSEGFSHAEIAATLGISEGNSRIRLARAMEQMLAPDTITSTRPESRS